MANARRIKRLEQVVLETVAQHIQHELDDPRIGLVSITRIKLSPDLSRGQVYWSCLGDEAETRTTERGLTDALASIQRAVAHAMQTRVTPRLGLIHDSSLANAQKLETIFTQLRRERGEEPGAAPGEHGQDETAGGEIEGDDASGPDDRTDDESEPHG